MTPKVIDGELIWDLQCEAEDEVDDAFSIGVVRAPFKEVGESTQEVYDRLAKKINDVLIYGKKPSKS